MTRSREIIEKVASILENTDNVVKMHIGIFADAGENPVIRYSIEESIFSEMDYDCEECCDCVPEEENRRCEREKRGEL